MTPSLAALLTTVFFAGITVGGGGGADVSSRYLWRGLALSTGPVLQPNAWLALGDASVGVWANSDLTRRASDPVINEVDVAIDWSRTVGPLLIRPSAGAYLFPRQLLGPNTAELGLAVLCPPDPGRLALATSHNVDIMNTPGAYYGEAGLESSWSLPLRFELAAGASLSWASARYNRACFDTARAALNAACATGRLCWAPWSWAAVTARVTVSTIIDRVLRTQVAEPTLMAVGLGVGVEF